MAVTVDDEELEIRRCPASAIVLAFRFLTFVTTYGEGESARYTTRRFALLTWRDTISQNKLIKNNPLYLYCKWASRGVLSLLG